MKKIYFNFLYLIGILSLVSGCTYDFPDPDPATLPSAGSADFSKLVVVGNSITAGFMDGALYDRGQQNSYGNIVATQLQTVGGGAFNQPDINATNGFFGFAPDGTTPLGRLIIPAGSSTPSPIVPGDPITPFTGDKAQLNNFGVPGSSITTALLPGYGTFNPYFARFASDPATATIIGDAANAQGSFFIMWLGSNNVLGYAISGATGVDGGSGPNDLTSVDAFTGAYNTALSQMLANGAKGVVANIPNVTDIPYFTTVPYNALVLDAATAQALNVGYTANAVSTIAPLVITEAIRLTQVIPGVVTEVVRLGAVEQGLQAGLPLADAEAQAAAFIASPDGLAQIQATVEQFIANPTAPEFAPLAQAVEQEMQGQTAQAGIQGFTTAYLAAYQANPSNPQASAGFTQSQFDQITAEVNNQVGLLQTSGALPVFQEGANPFVIDDPASPTGIRSMTPNELVTLTVPQDSITLWLPVGRGIPDQFILTESELAVINERTNQFNQAISAAVSANSANVGLMDANNIFDQFANNNNPSSFNGIGATASIVPPFGIFSYDGIHPNGRGHAWIANQFIRVMNQKFNANIPQVNENNFPGNDLPQ